MFKNKTVLTTGLLTGSLLFVIAIISVFFQLIALNGVGEAKAMRAMGIWLIFQIFIMVFSAGVAGWIAKFLAGRFNWNKAIAISAGVFSGTLLGVILTFIAIIVSMLMVGIR